MSREMIESVSPDQLADYLTCPNLFYFKHVAKIRVSCPGRKWMDRTIHQSIIQTLSAHESTDFCLQWFERIFTEGRDMDIDFKKDDPLELLVKGRGIIQLYTGSPWFVELTKIQCNRKMVIPMSFETTTSHLPCVLDGILPDHTILDIRLSSGVVKEEDYRRHPRFGFGAIALARILNLDDQIPTKIRCDILIKTIHPKLQILHFTISPSDKKRILLQTSKVMQAIECELFYPTPGILCANHCLYKTCCLSQYRGFNS